MKRVLVMALSLVLVLGLTLSGTIAYLTDTDAAVNVMTVGNVDIEQLENGQEEGGFAQGAPLYPAYYEEENINWDTAVGVLDKAVTVKNTGTSTAYVRTWFAFEAGDMNSADFQKYILLNTNEGADSPWTWVWDTSTPYKITDEKGETANYYLALATLNEALPVGATTEASLIDVAMSKYATNEQTKPLGDEYTVLAFSQAMQTINFETKTAAEALDIGFATRNAEGNGTDFAKHPWTEGITGTPVIAMNEAELAKALKAGGEVTLGCNIELTNNLVVPKGVSSTLNLNGHKLTQKKAQTDAYAMIENMGTLTITDSIGGGVIDYEDTTEYTSDINYASNTILNKGTLNIKGGTIVNSSSTAVSSFGFPHAIDTNSTSSNTSLNITGGTVKCENYAAIRMFCNSKNYMNAAYITGGTIVNSIDFQNPNDNANKGSLTITGGTFKTNNATTNNSTKYNVRFLNFGSDISNMAAFIDTDLGVTKVISNFEGTPDNATIETKVFGNKMVGTADELVSAFANANIKAGDMIALTADIDMTGKTLDATNGNVGFTLIGNGHTISNLKGNEQGLFVNNTGSSDYYFYDVHLKNCHVDSTGIVLDDNNGYAGLFVGDADTCDELVIQGCSATNCTVKSNKYAAAFVAYTAGYNVQNNGPVYSDVKIVDCAVTGGSITGDGSTAAAIAHAGGNVDTTSTITNLTVKDVKINGEDADHTGIAVGTANVGKTIINNVQFSGVTGNCGENLYGRFVPNGIGKLTIDGTVIN